jgi:nucleotide-binding universal stress UspA family protein
VIDLVEQHKPSAAHTLGRWGSRILGAITPDELEGGPAPGEWRKQFVEARQEECLFADILVPVSGKAGGWQALEQAIEVASREGAFVHGLHVTPSEELQDSEESKAVQERFEARLAAANIQGELTRTSGEVAHQICDRARYTDLIVVNVMYPPSPEPLARFSSGFSTIIRRCSRPILAVPFLEHGLDSPISKMTSALLAYGGSPKSEEALFVAAYLANRWGVKLEVLTILKRSGEVQPQEDLPQESDHETILLPMQERARQYLEDQNVDALYTPLLLGGAENIINQVEQNKHDLIIMGGYESVPVVEVMMGSTVDGVLRQTEVPVLICR